MEATLKEQEKNSVCPAKKTSIGGQALIEGIMMRGPKKTAMAVRNPEGKIVLEEWENKSSKRPAICRAPFIRGIFGFIDSMTVGYKCLMRSAEIAGVEEDSTKPAETVEEQPQSPETEQNAKTVSTDAKPTDENVAVSDGAAESDTLGASEATCACEGGHVTEPQVKEKKQGSGALFNILMVISSVLGIALAIGLFVFLPTFLYSLLAKAIPSIEDKFLLRAVFEGVFKIALFVGYMALISLMKDIRRTFMYHGAEHKTIFCYENGLPLTVENVRIQKRFHPRCGTSFMILMLLVSIIISMFIHISNPLIRTVVKLLLIPLFVGIGYELIKFAGRKNNWLTRIISAPGVWLQHISTKEPDDSMIECAIAAFKEVVPDDESDNW